MPRFQKAWRQKQKRKPKWTLLGRLLVLSIIALPMFLVVNKVSQSCYVDPKYFAPPPIRFRAARQVYPYSIVPGGVYEPREVAETIEADPIAREHYSDISQENLVPVRNQAPMLAYISFRKGDNIYWTSKKLNIPRGELLLTDGKNMIRARCGNRISQSIHLSKTSPQETDETLEAVFEAALPSITELPLSLQPVVSPGVPIADVWKQREAELSATPEPATLALYVSGLTLMFGGTWLQRYRFPHRESSEKTNSRQEIA